VLRFGRTTLAVNRGREPGGAGGGGRTHRTRRPHAVALSVGTTSALLLTLAGCGGGHTAGANDAAAAAGTTTPTASPPLRVTSVTPRRLTPTSPITVAYSSTLTAASPLPTLQPTTPGSWVRRGDTAVFTPSQAYPPDITLRVRAASQPGRHATQVARRTTPRGSLLRAQQILARLRYLPLSTSAATPQGSAAQAAAVYSPPAGSFSWRYGNVPATLRGDWSPGKPGTVLRGAVIAFQHEAGLPLDGAIGPKTWKALLAADAADHKNPAAYSYVSANLDLPQQLTVWVAGSTVLTSPVNGGVASAPTPLGTYPVYERFTSTTMQGTNPDGSHYQDPGVPWVNYFSGGSAVHGFPRSSYGSPQSVGCLELPIATAQRVYSLIGYGTLVTVSGPYVPPTTVSKPSAPSSTHSPSPTHSGKPTASPRPTATKSASHHPKPTPSPTKTHKH
jgi:peptidoglycan hydrolase-like protein with peptidoglycan-binding domain